MTLKAEMIEVCELCDERAGMHRLTKKGTLYCLELNDRGLEMVRIRRHNGTYWSEGLMFSIPVKYLVKGSFSKGLGEKIWKGITTYGST